MEKEFIKYEQAISLKELGFDEQCLAWYNYGELNIFHLDHLLDGYANEIKERPLAPLYQQAFRFFREKYDLFGSIQYLDDVAGYGYIITSVSINTEIAEKYFFPSKTYEEAELACLQKLIEIVNERTNRKTI